jgi:RNA polymerase sigma-70 factor (ECF subfamily)
MPATASSFSDEADLIERAKAGDDRAFAALVAPHRTMLYTVCFRILGRQQDAEDATQLALVAAWRNLDRFQHRSSFSTWLYRIAHNAALSIVRRRVPEPVEDPASHLPTPERWHEHSIVDADMVQRALEKIPPDFRSALVLREYAGMSYQEIAETLGIKPETAKTRISRARKAFMALLEIS